MEQKSLFLYMLECLADFFSHRDKMTTDAFEDAITSVPSSLYFGIQFIPIT